MKTKISGLREPTNFTGVAKKQMLASSVAAGDSDDLKPRYMAATRLVKLTLGRSPDPMQRKKVSVPVFSREAMEQVKTQMTIENAVAQTVSPKQPSGPVSGRSHNYKRGQSVGGTARDNSLSQERIPDELNQTVTHLHKRRFTMAAPMTTRNQHTQSMAANLNQADSSSAKHSFSLTARGRSLTSCKTHQKVPSNNLFRVASRLNKIRQGSPLYKKSALKQTHETLKSQVNETMQHTLRLATEVHQDDDHQDTMMM